MHFVGLLYSNLYSFFPKGIYICVKLMLFNAIEFHTLLQNMVRICISIVYTHIYTHVCVLNSAPAVQDFADHEVCLADCGNVGDYATWRQVYIRILHVL